jgi:hypothetical protein
MTRLWRTLREVLRGSCTDCGAPRTQLTNKAILGLCFAIGLYVSVLAVFLVDALRPAYWEPVEASIASVETLPLKGGKTAFQVVIAYRYEIGGEQRELSVTRGGEKRGLDEAEAKRVVAAHPVGDRLQAFADPRRPSELHVGWWGFDLKLLAVLAFLAASVIAIFDDLGERLDHVTWHACDRHGEPRRHPPSVDHRAGIKLEGFFGPRVGFFGLVVPYVLFVLVLVAQAKAEPVAGLVVFAAATALMLVSVSRFLREAWLFHRWRTTSLVQKGDVAFVAGATYRQRFEDSTGAEPWRGASLQLEHRVETLDEYEESYWTGERTHVVPVTIDAEGLSFTLPDGAPPPEWGFTERRRWTLSVDQGALYFDLDFAPASPPPERECREAGADVSLRSVVEAAGRCPRALPTANWLGAPPEWVDGLLREVYAQQELLLEHGQVVWASLVQANSQLFSPGEMDHPAMAVYSLDERFTTARELRLIAARLFDTKDDPVDRLSHVIADEYLEVWGQPLADWLSPHGSVRATALMIIRKHLPQGVLESRVFPLLIAPGRTPVVMMLPSEFWPPALLEAWR